MNEVKGTGFINRMKNAVKAFKGKPIDTLYFGVDLKRCDECEYKKNGLLRDNLLVTTGVRAAFMEHMGDITLPYGIDGEDKFVSFVSRTVGHYLCMPDRDVNYDEYIETALMNEYGSKKGD